MRFEKIKYVVLDIQGSDPQTALGIKWRMLVGYRSNISWHLSAPMNDFVDKIIHFVLTLP